MYLLDGSMLLNDGDLNQMGLQKRSLKDAGFEITQEDVFPVVKKDDIEKALLHLYLNKIEGWWNYEDRYIKYGICTKEEFWVYFRQGSAK